MSNNVRVEVFNAIKKVFSVYSIMNKYSYITSSFGLFSQPYTSKISISDAKINYSLS